MAQVTREDWISAGINQLRAHGPHNLSGEKLARRLDVTRGSFYHHFRNMDDFVDLLLDEWERAYTRHQLQDAHDRGGNPRAEMDLLLEAAWNADIDLEIAVRQWAFSNPRVRERVEAIDHFRLERIHQLYRQITGDDPKSARLAQIAYYGLLGLIHAWPRRNRDEMRSMILEIQNMLINDL